MEFIILGSGSSMGVPRPDGHFGNCDPNNKKNYRTRCCALLKTNTKNILIDTSPDLRYQLLKNKIINIDKVFYSHMHADQTHGINDLRIFFIKNKKKIDVYADPTTSRFLKKSFGYYFKNRNKQYPPMLNLKSISDKMYFKDNNKKILIRSIKVQHGNIDSICYVIDKKIAYISDVSKIFNKDIKYFMNLKHLVVDCLWYKPHQSHFNLDQSLDFIKKTNPKNAILTNLHSTLDYKSLLKILPTNVKPAYDGLKLMF